ncbi:hypothetical protein BC830DRAFT_787055 [Chytriomyces sp. MP71]|nr:hypothetical protein BC830DRAFT_787055 [Chytriomyces sp. MP71]
MLLRTRRFSTTQASRTRQLHPVLQVGADRAESADLYRSGSGTGMQKVANEVLSAEAVARLGRLSALRLQPTKANANSIANFSAGTAATANSPMSARAESVPSGGADAATVERDVNALLAMLKSISTVDTDGVEPLVSFAADASPELGIDDLKEAALEVPVAYGNSLFESSASLDQATLMFRARVTSSDLS